MSPNSALSYQRSTTSYDAQKPSGSINRRPSPILGTVTKFSLTWVWCVSFWTSTGAVIPFQQLHMGADDFAFFVEPKHGVKGYYFVVGGTPQAAFDAATKGGPPVPSHHSNLFKISPEPTTVTDTIAMTAAVLDLLRP
jgi:hypothetical protein